MNKSFGQGITILTFFFATWFALQQIDWVNILHVDQVADKTERKLGEIFWEVFKKTDEEIISSDVDSALDTLINQISVANNIDKSKLKIHVLRKDEFNAFALPDGHLVIYSGLIQNSTNPEELAGVISHEMAHIELNHVMKKLIKEVGLIALISITTGENGTTESIKHSVKTLSSNAFDRGLEKEADLKAVDYLLKAKVNPKPFADFLLKLADEENEMTRYLEWLSTHPDSRERAEYILEYSKKSNSTNATFEPLMADSTWLALKEAMN